MSSQNEFQYIEAKEFLNLPVIEISDVKSFMRLAKDNLVQHIFKIRTDNKVEFFFPHNSVVYKIAGDDFKTLEDMQQAQNRNYPDAKTYYIGTGKGFTNYQEYVDLDQTGIESKEDYLSAGTAGFKEGFEKFRLKYDDYKKGILTSVIPADIDNPVKLHKYALQKGIATYVEFEKIYNARFPDLLTYNDGLLKGFKDGWSYEDGRKRGFSDAKEYNEANKLHIEFKKDYDEYRFLKDLNQNRNYPYDQLQLLIALSNCDNGTIVSIADAKKMLQNAQEKLKKPTGVEGQKFIPMWYTRSIDQEDKLIAFLKGNEELKKFGFFNTEKNSFEIFKASAIKIFVDGSNVAYNGKGKPELKNIRLVIKELNFWKFKNVTVIVDASLKHKIKDPELLEEVKKECEYMEAPANTSADAFLIASAKKEKCLVVTNDKFEDWKAKDKWVSDKIASIRVAFTISKDERVNLSDLDKFREKSIGE